MGVFSSVWNNLINAVPQIVICVAKVIQDALTITPPSP